MSQTAGTQRSAREVLAQRIAGGAARRVQDRAAERAGQMAAMGKARARTRSAVMRCLDAIQREQGRSTSRLRRIQLTSARASITEALTKATTRHEYFRGLASAAQVLTKGNYRALGAEIQAIIDAHEREDAAQAA